MKRALENSSPSQTRFYTPKTPKHAHTRTQHTQTHTYTFLVHITYTMSVKFSPQLLLLSTEAECSGSHVTRDDSRNEIFVSTQKKFEHTDIVQKFFFFDCGVYN